MKRPARLLIACLTTIVSGVATESSIPAENGVIEQRLIKVMASDQVTSAVLERQGDLYTVRVVLDVAKFNARERAIVTANRERLAANPPPPEDLESERKSYFLGNSIAELRGTTIWAPCGKRTVGARLVDRPAQAVTVSERDNRVAVWLLKGDGTQILPGAYNCVADTAMVEVQYRFPIPDGERAVAAAVRIDNEYHIESVQPLQPRTLFE